MGADNVVDKLRQFEYPKPKFVEHVAEKIPLSFPRWFKKAKDNACFKKVFDTFREFHINFPLVDVLMEMPKYVKYLKYVIITK